MRIGFLGIPLAALLLHHDGHEIVLAGVMPKLGLGTKKLARMVGAGRIMPSPHKDWTRFEDRCRAAGVDLIVSWFFVKKIPVGVIASARLGGIGAHPSLLPRHRGPDPFFAAIDSGDPVTGVTVHRLAEQYDTGDILAQQVLIIRPDWNAWQLARRLDRVSLRLLRETVARVEQDDHVEGIAQDPCLATEAPSPGEQVQWIVWEESAERIVRRIRALAPQPGALTTLFGREVLVMRARCVDRSLEVLSAGQAMVLGGRVVVKAGRGGVELVEALVDGRRCNSDDLVNLIARNGSNPW